MTTSAPRWPRLPMALFLGLLLLASGAQAYEGGSTHPGITGRALLASQLHRFLRARGLDLGLFSDLGLDPETMSPRHISALRRDLGRLDPAAGIRPMALTQWAMGWAMAGSALQGLLEGAERHHFLDPTTSKGLGHQGPGPASAYGMLSVFESTDSVRSAATGTASGVSGMPATEWIRSDANAHSLDRFYAQLGRSVSAPTPARRRHHLALALIALGGVLHVLQDMGSPSHVRNDFSVGHMQRLGESSSNRGSAYERFVSVTYDHAGVPAYGGQPILRPSIDAYFHAPDWQGLASRTHAARWSPGNLPLPVRVFASTDAAELTKRVNATMRYAAPTIKAPIDLACARRRKCHLAGRDGSPLVAYAVGANGQLVFQLDRHCEAATARQLLPLTVGFSTGFVNHLLRGKATATWEGRALRVGVSAVPRRGTATVQLLAEDARGQRRRVGQGELGQKAETVTVPVSAKGLSGARKVVVLVTGRDAHEDRFSCETEVALNSTEASAAP